MSKNRKCYLTRIQTIVEPFLHICSHFVTISGAYRLLHGLLVKLTSLYPCPDSYWLQKPSCKHRHKSRPFDHQLQPLKGKKSFKFNFIFNLKLNASFIFQIFTLALIVYLQQHKILYSVKTAREVIKIYSRLYHLHYL